MNETLTHRPGRNDPCHCGSGRKYKQCCLEKDEAEARAAREQELAQAPEPSASAEGPVTKAPRHQTHQPWKKSAMNTHGFQRTSTPRKVGGS